MTKDFEIIVHRGHNLHQGENSLAGIEEIRALTTDFMIEVDICITADAIPILHHDITFDRLCNDSRTVAGTAYRDLPQRKDGEPIVRLDEMLESFPHQRFLLDLRTHIHEDFLRGSNLVVENFKPELERIIPALKGLLGAGNRDRLRLVCGNPEHRDRLMEAFPGFEVDIPEQFLRSHLNRLATFSNASILGPNSRRMYIRFREITPEIIEWAHKVGIKIIGNHAPSRRSLANSLMMLEKCLEWGMDGLTASPIDQRFIKAWSNRNFEGTAR